MLKSATRVALLLLVLTACITFGMRILSEMNFMIIIMSVLSFFFGIKVPGTTQPAALPGAPDGAVIEKTT